jgi:hypothetical protein
MAGLVPAIVFLMIADAFLADEELEEFAAADSVCSLSPLGRGVG